MLDGLTGMEAPFGSNRRSGGGPNGRVGIRPYIRFATVIWCPSLSLDVAPLGRPGASGAAPARGWGHRLRRRTAESVVNSIGPMVTLCHISWKIAWSVAVKLKLVEGIEGATAGVGRVSTGAGR